ncbi:MAG: helicase-related protein [Erysipelotrichaceae bacterium]|nr:helicase-related protein [Erysipelotrichaceae bacterium]
MRCPRCLNEDPSYFYHGSKGWMCRRCVSFKRVLILEEQAREKGLALSEAADEYSLSYPLTPLQQQVSQACADKILETDVLIEAICGAGKTELVFATIAKMLKMGKKVCFAISRRQVVIELHQRLAKTFTNAKVVKVCQGFSEEIYGDIVVCTTHQCYRYYQYFDCVILDESDAFPYKGNVVLAGIVKTSCKGHMVYLTATIDDYLRQRLKDQTIYHLQLNARPHGHDLPVPEKYVGFKGLLLLKLLAWIKKNHDKPLLIFVPTIKISQQMYHFLKLFYPCDYVNSKSLDLDHKITRFRQKETKLLIATTILERGVTIENVNVCIFLADHNVFDEASLIQMSGRVGKSFKYPKGACLFLCAKQSEEVDACIQKCQKANANKMFVV